MLKDVEFRVAFLGAFLLAALSIYTVERCRRDSAEHLTDKMRFLFEGKSRLHSLASNIGAVFSVTYFFGATFIYARIYQGALLFISIVIFLTLFFLLPYIINRIHHELPENTYDSKRCNLLLVYMKHKLSRGDFAIVTNLYAAIYFGLLIEELAVSRLILSTLFPFQPSIVALLLATICFVLLVYLAFGGFRAVLISDHEQLKAIFPFVLILMFLVFKEGQKTVSKDWISFPQINQVHSAFFAILFGVAWFGAAIDVYSRFNFNLDNDKAVRLQQSNLARISMICLFSLLFVGVIFGQHLASVLPRVDSPTSYTKTAIEYFLSNQSNLTSVVFLVSLFCMIFTTLDTILLTLLQNGAYSDSKLFRRKHLTKIVLSAVVISTAIRFDAVSAVGVFIGSLMLLPFLVVIQILSPLNFSDWIFPKRVHYTWLGALISIALFVMEYRQLELRFDRHFLIPGIVLGSSLVSLVLTITWERVVLRILKGRAK